MHTKTRDLGYFLLTGIALAGPALGVIPSTIPNVAGVAAPVRGIIMVHFFDGRMPLSGQSFIFTERPAMYQMFIQVERLP